MAVSEIRGSGPWLKRPPRQPIMSNGDLLKQLFRNYKEHNNLGFETVAQQIIAEERQKNHHVLAGDLQRILTNGSAPHSPSTGSGGVGGWQNGRFHPLPRNSEEESGLLEIRQPARYWPDLIVSPETQVLLERVITEVRRSELLETHGMRPKRRLLFCGPPGCGKTLTAEMLASELGLPLLYTRFDAVISSYLGQTAAHLRKIFEYASEGRWVLFFDEFDAIGKSRDNISEHGELKRVVNSFLQLLDNFHAPSLVIAATNYEGLLDRALWRRFDEIIRFDRPTREQIPAIVKRKLSAFRHKSLKLTDALLDQMVGFSHADIERVCFDAIKEALLNGQTELANQEFLAALTQEQRRQALIAATTNTQPS